MLKGIWFWTKILSVSLQPYSPKLYSGEIKPVKMVFDLFQNKDTETSLPPVVIMHGLFASKRNWLGICQKLQPKLKRKIYCVDARNHGDSPHDSNHSSAHMSEDIKELMKSENISKISILGHSMGGRTMMYFALKYSDLVESVIIIDVSPFSLPKKSSEMEQVFLAMKNISVPPNTSLAKARKIVRDQIKSAIKDVENLDFILMDLKKLESGKIVWRANVSSLHSNFQQYNSTAQDISSFGPYLGPAMFICGKQSLYVLPDHWLKLQQIFPNSEIHWLDAGHLIHIERPVELVDLVVKFLKK